MWAINITSSSTTAETRWFSRRFDTKFAWQKGFGVFSVSRSGMKAVVDYISDQEVHHNRRDFRQEFSAMLRKNNVDYDEKFLWK
jgi:hypothetical protein